MSRVTTSTGTEIAPAARELGTWLSEQRFGGLRLLDVRLDLAFDLSGDEVLYLDVVLPTPPPGDTWPLDEIIEMRMAVRDKALELGVAWPWHVRVRPETEEPEPPDMDPDPPGHR